MWVGIILETLGSVGKGIANAWTKYPKLRLPLIIVAISVGAYGAGKMWLNDHDANLIASNNKMWQDSIAHGTHKITKDTSWTTHQDSATAQSKQGISTNQNWRNSAEYKAQVAKWKKDSSSLDEALAYFTEPIQATFEDSTSIDTVDYRPVGFPPRLLSLTKHPKPQRIPMVTITDQTLVPMPPEVYIPFHWWNPRLHADVFPFTDNGILMGLSASLCSYGTDPKPSGMILFLPTIGLATDTKKLLIGTVGIRWNVAHYIGFIQDTHLIISYTTKKQILFGIGTSL